MRNVVRSTTLVSKLAHKLVVVWKTISKATCTPAYNRLLTIKYVIEDSTIFQSNLIAPYTVVSAREKMSGYMSWQTFFQVLPKGYNFARLFCFPGLVCFRVKSHGHNFEADSCIFYMNCQSKTISRAFSLCENFANTQK